MFAETSNPYQFKYLITGITGPGIQNVYLPPTPKPDEILFKTEQKWTKIKPAEHLRKAINEYTVRVQEDENYIHPLQAQINQWADQEWDRSEKGVWFWNNGVATYITKFYYWYLTAWRMYFGDAEYRETDKEITYMLEYVEEDPECFGLLLNTIRRYGKSSLMGAWAVYRATKNFNHYVGMQGETDLKVEAFYRMMIKNPFKRLPYYYMPDYNTNSTLAANIQFVQTEVRGTDVVIGVANYDELGSVIEFRASGAGEYDQAVLHSYLCEEPGKTLRCDINDRWSTVKPCLSRGKFIRGKAFMGTTVEFMDVASKGGRAYKKLFYESDFNQKHATKRTSSGLYAAFLPGDCAYEGFFDEWGHPIRDEARQSILLEREVKRKNPKDYGNLVRKYPLTIKEIFYVSADRCEFNAMILQDRKSELEMLVEPILTRGDFYWVNNKRFGQVAFRHNPVNGWAWVHTLIADPKMRNLVNMKVIHGVQKYSPGNDARYIAGLDPIDHGVVIEGKGGDEEYISTRRSIPVLLVKNKYDVTIDGPLTQEILEQRRDERYQYKTNRYVAMMDVRPNDPNVFYERSLLTCWYFGCSLHPEPQKPGVINYFYTENCGDFILGKYVPEGVQQQRNTFMDGTPASTLTINEYTGALSTYIEYWGHTIPFPEVLDDLLLFNPKKTTEFDYSVAMGYTELGERIKPKTRTLPLMEIYDIMPGYNKSGDVVR